MTMKNPRIEEETFGKLNFLKNFTTEWWQLKHFWNFHPWGNLIQFDEFAYFSNGLVQNSSPGVPEWWNLEGGWESLGTTKNLSRGTEAGEVCDQLGPLVMNAVYRGMKYYPVIYRDYFISQL